MTVFLAGLATGAALVLLGQALWAVLAGAEDDPERWYADDPNS